MRIANVAQLALLAAALATPSCMALPSVARGPAPIPLDAVVRPEPKRVQVCDASGCVHLTPAELRAVVRDL